MKGMKKSVGVDIGNHSIKLIELEDKKGHLTLTKCALSRIVRGDIESALRNLMSLTKLSLRHVNVSLSGSAVIVRYIEMPPMKEEELKSAIKFEAEKYIPFTINDSIVDCAILDKTLAGTQRVLLVAVKKNEVDNLVKLFKNVGMDINIVDIDSLALLNSFQRLNLDADKKNTYAIIDMGARFLNMNIISDGKVYFTRDILGGGADIVRRISDVMGVSLEEAEALQQNPAEKKAEISSVAMPVMERIISQIRMSFDYFESQIGKSVERLYISGGVSYLFNMVDFLKDNLGIETILWNPLDGISVLESIEEVERFPALFTVAVGLALRK
ncbi:MAG: pilus assembly protein PilM [Candidatus Omnitrophica bacterium]|nr:pilus assembly protein PilM [Candidatus Omnitrophota bacterium]MBU1853393.1 pilus assembly protein PilM [Candidatus Omnitrophota bacterium]